MDKLCDTITETYGIGSEILRKRKEVTKKRKKDIQKDGQEKPDTGVFQKKNG